MRLKNSSLFLFLFLFLFSCVPYTYAQPLDSANPDGKTAEMPQAKPAAEDLKPEAASYVYDLKKLIEKSKSNIKRVNEKMKEQAIFNRNQNREEKSREYYEQGMKLFDEGKLDEARGYFEKAVQITEHPEMKNYVKDSGRRFKVQAAALEKQEQERLDRLDEVNKEKAQQVEEAYVAAVSLYKQKKFRPAKEEFEHVEELSADYKATRSYLKIVEQDIIQDDTQQLKAQKQEMEHQQKEAEVARSKEKESWRQEIEQKEKERKQQLQSQAEDVYVQALALYRQKKFLDAKGKFQEVEWVIPDYKSTRSYLDRMERDIQKEQERLGQEKQKNLQQQRWQEEVDAKKNEAQRQRQLGIKEKEQHNQLQEKADFAYQGAVALFKKNLLDDAKAKFLEVEEISPDYRSTRKYLDRIDSEWSQKIQKPKEQTAEPKNTPSLYKQPEEDLGKQPDKELSVAVSEQKSEGQLKDTEEIQALAKQARALYQQILDIASDRYTSTTKKKLGQIDRIFSDLQKQQKELMEQVLRAEALAKKQEEQERNKQLTQEQEAREKC